MPFIQLPEFLNKIPIVTFFFRIFDNQSVMTWIALIMVGLVWYFMYRTPTGIYLRAVGENPQAAASVGINVIRTRYLALLLSGLCAGLGGIYMSMGYLTFFQSNMTAGRGFIALATPYLGGGNPIGTGLASLVFGFFDALSNRIGSLDIPSQLPQMMPYFATVLALVIYALQSQLTSRVRTLRSAEGEGFDTRFWRSIQRLSVLHTLMAMFAVFGILVSLSMFSAPHGFKGANEAMSNAYIFWRAAGIGLIALALIIINLPFILQVERIGKWDWWKSAGIVIASLWVYLGLFFMLFLISLRSQEWAADLSDGALVAGGLAVGLAASVATWLLLDGPYLARTRHYAPAAAAA